MDHENKGIFGSYENKNTIGEISVGVAIGAFLALAGAGFVGILLLDTFNRQL